MSDKKINKITKKEVIDKVHESTGLELKDLYLAFDGILQEFKDALKNGSTIELRGFGTFEPRLRQGREHARNPRTGESVSVKPHYVAGFKPGVELRKALLERPVESEE